MADQPTIGIISLGCPKATVDSERILTQLRAEGYQLTNRYEDADLVIVNTCGFIDAAVEESLEAIGEALDENGRVLVTGCLGAKPEQIEAVHPSVLAITGPAAYEAVLEQVHQVVPPPEHNPFVDLIPPGGLKLTPRHYAYIKISEGCNHRCSFCIIPSMRGDLVSRPIGEVLDEAQKLVEAGVKELLVVSQDTAAYGVDLQHQLDFWQGHPLKTNMVALAEQMGKLGAWVRLHYVYPYPNVEAVIPLMRDGLVLPYLDMPLQHAHPRVLKAMRRPGNIERQLERIETWRSQVPDLTMRSTFIVGFPGETDEEFETLLEFIQAAQLDRVGCFQYSPVEGAAANTLAPQVPDEVKQERWDAFMATQQAISATKMQAKVGKTLEVIIDEVDEEGAIGRTKGDAPEIDGVVLIRDGQQLTPGDIVQAEIEAADAYDLWGRVKR
ncbi:MAG TPA: 30S ribosomal protein S12 methylthiotransferase RimO [Sulfurivirga caldicuralii]|nr:30S ribosomal protein S12 methylthiotransferase RimO [Sulfurivirga caldicuralii]